MLRVQITYLGVGWGKGRGWECKYETADGVRRGRLGEQSPGGEGGVDQPMGLELQSSKRAFGADQPVPFLWVSFSFYPPTPSF